MVPALEPVGAAAEKFKSPPSPPIATRSVNHSTTRWTRRPSRTTRPSGTSLKKSLKKSKDKLMTLAGRKIRRFSVESEKTVRWFFEGIKGETFLPRIYQLSRGEYEKERENECDSNPYSRLRDNCRHPMKRVLVLVVWPALQGEPQDEGCTHLMSSPTIGLLVCCSN